VPLDTPIPDSPAPTHPVKTHGDLPHLVVMHLADLVPHEQADPRRVERLAVRLRRDEILKNPIIGAPMPGTAQAVVLDGANRTAALHVAGVRDALVQLVDYHDPGVRLTTWHHLISGLPPQTLLDQIRAIPGLTLRPASLSAARACLAQRSILAYLVTPLPASDGRLQVFTIRAPEDDGSHNHTDTHLLLRMVDIYKGKPDTAIHRVTNDHLAELLPNYDEVSGLIVFPPYTPDDILHLAGHGLRVPTGITRHIIPARALRVNVPLAVLRSDQPLAEKNAWWHERVKAKLADNEIRFYQESTYLFDE
jgi:hypothetical protein